MSRGDLIRRKINYLKNSFLSVVYPVCYNCLDCNVEIDNTGLCLKCLEKIEFCTSVNKIIDINVYSVAYYGYSIKKLILDFKYKSNFDSGNYLGKLLLNKLQDIDVNFDYITYVPCSNRQLKDREFNQCEVLGKYLYKNTGISCIELLKKADKIKEQKFLTAKERKENIKNAFLLIKRDKLEGKKVLLIDDVITTGATLEACVKELKKIKDIKLTILVVAKNFN